MNNSDDLFLFADSTAESFVIGSLVSPTTSKWLTEALNLCAPDDFCDPINKAAFLAARSLRDKGQVVDMINVDKILRMQGLNSGPTVFAIFCNSPMNDHEFRYYFNRLKDKAKQRKIYRTCDIVKGLVECGTTDEAVDTLRNIVADLTTSDGFQRIRLTPKQLADSMLDTVARFQNIEWRNANIVMTGIKALDDNLSGFRRGNVIIISGATGTGKSAQAMDLSYCIGVQQNIPVTYINSEMEQDEVNLRLAARAADVSHAALIDGKATDEDLKKVKEATEQRIKPSNLYVAKCDDLSFEYIAEELNIAVGRGIRIVIVDYYGRSDFLSNTSGAAEWQILKDGARRLKQYAKQHNIVIILMAQTNADGQLAACKAMANEVDCWLNIVKIPKNDLSKTWPFNYSLEIRKGRSVKSDVIIGSYFDGDKMTFCYDRQEAESRNPKQPTPVCA